VGRSTARCWTFVHWDCRVRYCQSRSSYLRCRFIAAGPAHARRPYARARRPNSGVMPRRFAIAKTSRRRQEQRLSRTGCRTSVVGNQSGRRSPVCPGVDTPGILTGPTSAARCKPTARHRPGHVASAKPGGRFGQAEMHSVIEMVYPLSETAGKSGQALTGVDGDVAISWSNVPKVQRPGW